jgi:hypothetical protein
MNYIKALKIYNDRKGEKNEWCVYKKGTPEYLEVMKIMKDFKEKPIKEKAANVISNAFKIKQAKQELEKLKLEKAKKEINKIFKDIPKLEDVFKEIDKKNKYTDKDKQVLKNIIKKIYEIIDKYDIIKKDLLFIKDDIIKYAKLEKEIIDKKYINYNDFIDEYLLLKLNTALIDIKTDKHDIVSGSNSFDDIIRKIISSFYIEDTIIYRKFDDVLLNNLINDKFNIEDTKKEINRTIKIRQAKQELEKLKLEKAKKEEPKPQVNKRIKELKTSTYIPSNYLFNKEFYFDNDVWDKKYTMTDLINNWDTDIIPIIFYKIEPKLYNTFEDMIKRVNGLTSKRGLKKDTSLIIPELLVFTKDINKKIVEHYIKEAGTRKYKYKYAIDKLYMGMFRIIERIYIELNIPRTNITNVFGDDQETVYLRGVKQGLPLLTLQNASKEMLFFDDKQGTFIRNPETLL